MDLNKQQVLDADPKPSQKINLTRNVGRNENTTMIFIVEEVKETILIFSQGTVRVMWMLLQDLTRVDKVFDHTACSIIYFALI